MNLYEFMDIYEDVFSPIYYMFFCALAVIYFDSRRTKKLWKGVAVAIVAYAIAYSTYSIWFYLPPAPQWVEDLLAVTGLMIAIFISLLALKKRIYNGLVEKAIYILIVLTVPYMAISPFWNISGHVAYTTAPTLYLCRIRKKLYPLMLIPLIMLVNRPYLGAHSVGESLAGFLLGVISVFTGSYLYENIIINRDAVSAGSPLCSGSWVSDPEDRHTSQAADEHKLPR